MFDEINLNLDRGVISKLDVNRFKSVLVLTGTYYSKNVFEKNIQPLIKTKFCVYPGLTPNITDADVYSVVNFAYAKDIDCILSVGGAGVMSCGKLVNLLLSHGGLLHNYLQGGTIGPLGITPNVIYHITIPVMGGMGTEISDSASFIYNKKKYVIASPYLAPKATYLDPELLIGVSSKRWADVSFECFATALAAYVSSYANHTSDSFAHEALKGYLKYLPKLLEDTNNIEYIKQMEVASINAMLASSLSSTGTAHAIASMLSARFNIHFSIALAGVCAQVSGLNYKYRKEKYDKVLEMMGSKDTDIKTAIQRLIEKSKIEVPSLKNKLDLSQIAQLSRECVNYDVRGNPKVLTPVEIANILEGL